MKNAKEITRKQLESILDTQVDWTEVHKLRVFSEWAAQIHIHTDGSISEMNSSTYYRDPDAAGVIGTLKAVGMGNIYTTDYLEGFVEYDDEAGMYTDKSGKTYTFDEALTDAIEHGDWVETYDSWKDEILRAYDQQKKLEN